MEQSKGFTEGGDNIVWKHCKTLYGTIQGDNNWFKMLSYAYRELGYK